MIIEASEVKKLLKKIKKANKNRFPDEELLEFVLVVRQPVTEKTLLKIITGKVPASAKLWP